MISEKWDRSRGDGVKHLGRTVPERAEGDQGSGGDVIDFRDRVMGE